jgi:hypothetical protein
LISHDPKRMHIRPYTPQDWPRVCAIHDAARRDELAAAGLDCVARQFKPGAGPVVAGV